MTRKRFIKLMMAKGYSRNSANRIAVTAQEKGATYAEMHEAAITFNRIVDAIMPAITKVAKTVGTMVKAAAEAVAAFAKTFQEAMVEE